jgi:type I restriction enzyme S subunit
MTFYPIATSADQKLARAEWSWHRLQELAKLESGHTPSRKVPEWWGGEIPWLALPDIREVDGKVIDDTSEHTNEMGLANSSARLLPKDTVALSRTASVGFVTRFGRPMATSQDFANWICGHNLDPGFLVHALRYSRPYLLTVASGAIHKTIYMNVLEDLRIFCPPLETQHRIAAELDEQLSAIDEARAAAERRVAAAEALEAALLREHFHGLTPVRIGLPKEAAPAAWKWTRLVELADLESGHTPSRKHPEWWGGDIPWLALPDIRALDGKVAMESKQNTNKLGIANSSARILPQDTVALSRTASVGFVTIFGRPMATSQDFVNWVCGKDLSPAFLLHALRASRQHFLANASGAIHKTLYMPAVKDFHLCHPTRKAQESLAAVLSTRLADAATLLTAARAELAAIQALPAAALRRVFS